MCLRSKAMYTQISRPVFLLFFFAIKYFREVGKSTVNAAATLEEKR